MGVTPHMTKGEIVKNAQISFCIEANDNFGFLFVSLAGLESAQEWRQVCCQ